MSYFLVWYESGEEEKLGNGHTADFDAEYGDDIAAKAEKIIHEYYSNLPNVLDINVTYSVDFENENGEYCGPAVRDGVLRRRVG